MADISAQPIPDMGNLLTSYGRNLATTDQINAQAGLARAETGLTGAQQGLINVQTQRQALEVQMIRDALNSKPSPDNSQNDQSGVDSSETGIASTLNKKFMVDPMGPPSLRPYLTNPGLALASPQLVQRADEIRKIYNDSQTARNQNEANDIFQSSVALQDSPDPLGSLLKLRPGSYLNNVGRAINTMDDKTPEEKEELAKNAIGYAAKYSHQYTNRPVDVKGDEYRDQATGFPVYGVPKVGPTPGEQIDIGKWANTPQTWTVGNRDTTLTPKSLGIHSYQDLTDFMKRNPTMKPKTMPSNTAQANPTAGSGNTSNPPGQASTNPPKYVGLSQEQSDFVDKLPQGISKIPGNSKLNATDQKQRDLYIDQAKKLTDQINTDSARAHDSLKDINQIVSLLSDPKLKLGPGSKPWADTETFLNQWVGTPEGQAGAYQVLAKVLNASEMNDLLQKFHTEGAQVRLGAYESRLIMEKLAANPNLSRDAIQQMLKWQGSDAQYTLQKNNVASTAIKAGKNVGTFETDYGKAFPKENLVDTAVTQLASNKGVKMPNFDAAKGKTYSVAEVQKVALQAGIPLPLFEEKLRRAGANIR